MEAMKLGVWVSNQPAAPPTNSSVVMARVYQSNGNAIWNKVCRSFPH